MSAKRTEKTGVNRDIGGAIDIKGLTRERPWLLPSNRKLRHLEGITLRNILLSRPNAPTQAKTNDDTSLPTTLRTPTKTLALRERKLEHSRSSSDLHSTLKARNAVENDDGEEAQRRALENIRPQIGRMRRRSTVNWTNATPQVRQKKLEDVTGTKLADTWFSLHCEGVLEPLYVSEVIEKAMNINFRFFDLNTYGPWVTRKDELTIKFWARTEAAEDYRLFLQLRVHLRSLQYIGKTLENFHHPLPPNCVLLHLSDGIYTSFTDLPLDEPVLAIAVDTKNGHSVQPTSTYDELMRLSNLDSCIQDALATREKLTSQINTLLESQKEPRHLIESAAKEQVSLAATRTAVATVRRQIKTGQTRRSELQVSLQTRRDAIRAGVSSQAESKSKLDAAQAELPNKVKARFETQSDTKGQIRRICEDLFQIYPVEPIPKKALAFTVCNLSLPNATSPSSEPSTTAAALGYVAHVTYLLSLYLSVSLPYPLNANGSSSTIFDPISASLQSDAARTFPLYQKGAVAYRFEYGVFLLNSDIEILMSKQGIRIVDLRHTLPNLKYLLTVLTSGDGELPGRREGRAILSPSFRSDDVAKGESSSGGAFREDENGTLTRFKLNARASTSRFQSPLGRHETYLSRGD
ncbi:MAG: hypothetical protein Q9174_002835 [Haloplaca sp. 1 TL-2023]